MLKGVLRRAISLLLSFVMVLGMLPGMEIPIAHAVDGSIDLGVEGLSVSYKDAKEWDSSTNSLTVAGTDGQCGGDGSSNTATLTFRNTLNVSAKLIITCNVSGTVKVGETTLTSGSHEYSLGAAGSTESSDSIVITLVSGTDSTSIASISNLSANLIPDGVKSVTFLKPENGSYTVNSVEVLDTVQLSTEDSYALSATPSNGYVFYGWMSGNELLSSEPNVTLPINNGLEVHPAFILQTTPAFMVGSQHFFLLSEAVAAAQAGLGTTIVMVRSGVVAESVTIQSEYTLLLPYAAGATSVNDQNHTHRYANSTSNPNKSAAVSTCGDGNTYLTLTLSGASLSVNGKLIVGGTYSASQGNLLGGQTYGSHSDIVMDNNSSIIVGSGGILSTVGYIVGGTVNVAGGSLYEPYVIADFHGGTYTSAAYNTRTVCPFNVYSANNIQSTIHLSGNANLYGYCALVAQGEYNTTTSTIITSESSGQNALLIMTTGATASIVYNANVRETSVRPTFGCAVVRIDGGAKYGYLSLDVAGVTVKTNTLFFPLPYTYQFELYNGNYDIPYKLKIMPGSKITVGSGATLNVTSELFIYDGLEQVSYATHHMYPTGKQLSGSGLDERGRLIVDGGTVKVTGALAGLVETTGNGILEIDKNASLTIAALREGVVKGDGAIPIITDGATHTNMTQTTQSARIYDYNSGVSAVVVKDETAELTTYYAANGNYTSESGFSYEKFDDSEAATAVNKTYESAETVRGQWASEFIVVLDVNGGKFSETDTNTTKTYSGAPTVTIPVTENPIWANHVFDGWYTTAEGDDGEYYDLSKENIVDRKSITLYARWRGEEKSVILDDGDSKTTFDVVYGQPYGTLPTPVKDGHTFLGWFTDETAGTQVTSTTPYNGETELYAHWSKNTYTVTFLDGDTVLQTADIEYGGSITVPTPTKYGYTLGGWTVTGSVSGAIDALPSSVPAENLTCTANWNPVEKITVSFFLLPTDDESYADKQIAYFGDPYILPDTDPVRDGYKFDGWYVEKDGQRVDIDGSTPVTIAEAHNAYAAWTPVVYDIVCVVDGVSSTTTYTIESDDITLVNPTKTGYTFAGWTGTDLTEATENVTIPKGSSGDRTYTATWTANTDTVYTVKHWLEKLNSSEYELVLTETPTGTTGAQVTPEVRNYEGFNAPAAETVTIAADGTTVVEYKYTRNSYDLVWKLETDGAVHSSGKLEFGATITDPAATPSMTGYTFVAWADSTSGELWTDAATMPASDVTYIAQWEKNTYTITFMDGTTVLQSGSVDHGDAITVPTVDNKTGYTCVGWMDAEGKSIEVPETASADGTYYVNWQVNRHMLTWDFGNGTVTGTYPSGSVEFGTAIVLPEVKKEGHELSWTATDGEGNSISAPATMPDYDVVITANWTAVKVTVTVSAGEKGTIVGSTESSETSETSYGTTITLPEVEKTGYSLTGWTDGDGNTVAGKDDKTLTIDTTENLTLTAQWAPNQYKVTFNAGQGTMPATEWTVTYDTTYGANGQSTRTLPTPVRDGYEFLGWFTTPADDVIGGVVTAAEEDIQITEDTPVDILEDTVLYARWAKNQYVIVVITDNGEPDQTITEPHGTEISIAVPVKEGHYFQHWLGSDGQTYEAAPTAMPVIPGGRLTLTAQWEKERYTFKFNTNGGNPIADITVAFGETVNVPEDPEKVGWTFDGWDGEIPAVMPDLGDDGAERTFTASWKANTNTPYTVEHWLEKLNSDEYELKETDELTGTTGGEVTPAVQSYDGFTAPAAETVLIEADGSTKVVYRYTRNSYTFKFDTAGGKPIESITKEYGDSIVKPADPEKAGYTFTVWSEEIPAVMPYLGANGTEKTFVAGWAIVTYDIGYALDGGELPEGKSNPDTYTVESDEITLVNPVREGYSFTGWTGSNGNTPQTLVKIPQGTTGDLSYTANWAINQYTITFDSKGGSEVAEIKRDFNAAVSAPEEPTRTGYTFDGWYADGAEEEYVFSTMPSENIVLYAKWNANEYSVVFEANDGTGEMAPQIFLYDQEETALTLNSMTREGYAFDGWNTQADGKGTHYDDGQKVQNLATSGEVKLYAMWKADAVNYTVIHKLQDTEGDGYTVDITTTQTGTTGENTAAETKEYTGFTVKSVETKVIAADGKTEVVVLYDRNVHTLRFLIDEGDAVAYETVDIRFGADIVAPENAPEKVGHTFVSWNIPEGAIMPDADVDYVAEWTTNRYTITFVTDGGSALESVSVAYGGEIPAPGTTTKTGYDFAGWTVTGEDGRVIEELTTMPAENITYTAGWTINQYTITFDTDGGSEVAAITQNYNSAVTAPAAPTRTGYTFAGWEPEVPAAMPAENVTIKAQWTVNQYTITFDSNGGTDVPAITGDYDSNVTIPADPTREGYTFNGWDEEIPATMPAEDMTITAQWEIESYTIHFAETGDHVIGSITAVYGAQIDIPADPTKTGHNFAGWDGEIPAVMPDLGDDGAEKTFTAQWTVNTYTITYDVDGGTVLEQKTLAYGADVPAPGTTTKTGCTFAGWTITGEESGEMDAPATMPAENITYTAKWTVNEYTITFDAKGGSGVGNITEAYGAAVTAPAAPSLTGYTFVGWYLEGAESAYQFTTMPAEDITLYAKWAANTDTQYVVKHYLQQLDGEYGEAKETENKTGTTGEEVTPEVKSYEGFAVPEAETVTIAADGSTVVEYHYTRKSFTITFDAKGGSEVGSITQLYGAAVTAPEAPDLVGYSFAGWYLEGAESTYQFTTMPAENFTLYAKWTANTDTQYVVKHYLQQLDGEYGEAKDTENKTGTTGEEVTPEVKSYEGFAAPEAETVTIAADGSTVVEYHYTRKSFTITFDAKGGSKVGSITELYGAAVTAPAAPELVGYTFAGWYLEGAESAYQFTTMPAENFTLYAKWTANTDTEYTVEHYLQNVDGTYGDAEETETLAGTTGEEVTPEVKRYEGFAVPETQTVTIKADGSTVVKYYYVRNTYSLTVDLGYGENVTVSEFVFGADVDYPEDPQRSGYVFMRWTGDMPATMPVTGVSITAEWQIVTYSIAYELDGGSIVDEVKNYTVESETFKLPQPTKPGYTFDGWISAGNQTPQVDVSVEKGTVGDLSFTAKWTANVYVIRYDANGGVGTMADQNVRYDREAYLNRGAFTRSGYTFLGWNTEKDGSGRFFEDLQGITNLAESGVVTLYAQWKANTFTVSFQANGGSGTMESMSVLHGGENQTAPDSAFTRTGYTFAKWNTAMDGKGTTYEVGADLSAITASMTLFAQWTANVYTVSFDANGGTGDMEEQSFTYGKAQVLSAAVFERVGYTFAGWNTEANGSGTSYGAGAEVSNLTAENGGQVKLYAQWSICAYTITYDAQGGTGVVASVEQNYNSTVTDPGIPVKPGSRFDGWYHGENKVEFPTTMPGEDVTYTAKWTRYLDLLLEYKETDFGDDAKLTEARALYAQMRLDAQQMAEYERDHASHRSALFAAIKVYSEKALEQSIIDAVPATNQLLTTEDGAIATLSVPESEDGEQGTARKVEVRIDDPTYGAAGLLNINFLTTMFSNEEIKTIYFPDLDGETDSNGAPLHICSRNESSKQFDQFGLMLRIAYITLGGDMSYDEFYSWLKDNMDITVGAMDGKSVSATLLAETVEGVTYTADYVMSFYNGCHTVTWDGNGGTFSVDGESVEHVTTSVAEDEKITKPEQEPVRTGYRFSGWTGYVDGAVMKRQDVTYTAGWELVTYTIAYELGGGSTTNPVEYTVESDTITLKEPVREGYTFNGWTYEGVMEPVKEVTIPAGSTGNRSYTASWSAVTYTITYLDASGEPIAGLAPMTYTVETDTFTLPVPEKTGHTFAGWTGTDLDKATVNVTIPVGSMGNKTYTANWTANVYHVTLNTDGGVLPEGAQDTISAVFGKQYQLPVPTREGYTFDGWYLGEVKITNATTVEITTDVTLVAKWSVGAGYQISYELNGGSWPENADVRDTYKVDATDYTLPTPVREGYTFAGWTGTGLEEMTEQVVIPTGSTGDRSYEANWTVNQYTITFVDTDGRELASITKNYGEPITAPEDPAKVGYTFAGWDKEIPAAMPAGDMTITAQWTVQGFTITFVDTDGSEIAVIAKNFGEPIIAPEDPAKVGYTFAGWDKEIPATMPAENVTITAQWTINQYTITFDTAGGEPVEAITLDYGAEVTAPADPTREGYSFVAWDKEIPATMPAEDMTITAKWKVISYKLTYIVDGQIHKEQTLNYGATIAKEAEPTKTGYTFSGWSETLKTMPARDVTITGSFTANSYQVSFELNYVTTEAFEPVSVTYDQVYGELPAPERTGYTFAGWFLGENEVRSDTVVQTAADHTLVAKWNANRYTVKLDANGGTCDIASLEVTFGETYAGLPVPERDGYEFIGWFDGDTQIDADSRVSIIGEQSLVAKWNAQGDTRYTVVHYQQNVDNDEYTEVKREVFTGATDSTANAKQEIYTGFVFNAAASTVSGTIAADESLVLELFYDREVYTVVWKLDGNTTSETYRYGAQLKEPDTSKADDMYASYTFAGWEPALSGTVTAPATYEGSYTMAYEVAVIKADGTIQSTYRTLDLAMANAKRGDNLRLEQDIVLKQDLVVPAGVTLVLPCIDNDPGYVHRTHTNQDIWFNQDGTTTAGTVGKGPDAKLYSKLTIPVGVTLTVEGTVMINAVTGRNSGGHNDMDVTGGYAQVDLEGNIIVADGGTLECFGYVFGEGLITARKGGTVGDLFIVRNWRGGTLAEKMYNAGVYPMNESDCRNIEADLRIEYGAALVGLVKMNASLSGVNNYYYTRFPQVDVWNGLIRLKDENGYVLRSYDSANEREIYEIHGGADFAYSALNILGLDLSSGSFRYPIDGDMDYILVDGDYTFTNDYKVLTGATMTVQETASLKIAEKDASGDGSRVEVVFYDEFKDKPNTDNTEYPDMPAAVLKLEGDATFTNAGTFAGTIVTEGNNVYGENNAQWELSTYEANGYALTKPYVVVLNFDLTMECEDYIWRYGVVANGESEGSIIWYKRNSFGVNGIVKTAANNVVTVLTETYNTMDHDGTCMLIIAAYDANGKMLSFTVKDLFEVSAGSFVFDEIRVETETRASSVEVFIVDGTYGPLAQSVPLEVK